MWVAALEPALAVIHQTACNLREGASSKGSVEEWNGRCSDGRSEGPRPTSHHTKVGSYSAFTFVFWTVCRNDPEWSYTTGHLARWGSGDDLYYGALSTHNPLSDPVIRYDRTPEERVEAAARNVTTIVCTVHRTSQTGSSYATHGSIFGDIHSESLKHHLMTPPHPLEVARKQAAERGEKLPALTRQYVVLIVSFQLKTSL